MQAYKRAQYLLASFRASDANERILYGDSIAMAAAGAATAFTSAYLIRLGAPNALLGLMSSIPALLSVLLFVPGGMLLQRREGHRRWIVLNQLASRLAYLFVALLPLVVDRNLAPLSAALVIATTIPNIFYSVAWTPLLSDVIPLEARARVLSWRTTLSNVVSAPLVFLAGRWLEWWEFPANYQSLYVIGFAIGLLHVWLLSRIREPESRPRPVPPRGASLPELADLSVFRDNPPFGRLLVNKVLFDLGMIMSGPLFMVYYVRLLGAGEGWIGINSMLTSIGTVVGLAVWRRLLPRIGENRALRLAAPAISSAAVLIPLVPNLTAILLANVLSCAIGSGAGLSLDMLYLGTLPAGRKATAAGWYHTVFSIVAMILPMLGVALADRIGVVPTLVLAGCLRVAGTLVFYVRPVVAAEMTTATPATERP
jgi:MFS family permease